MKKEMIKLCKPTGEQITTLSDVLHTSRIRRYSGVDELRFSMPEFVEDTESGHQIINSDIDNVKYDYIVKYDNRMYIIKGMEKRLENGVKYVDIICYGKVIQLKSRKCRIKTGIVQGDNIISSKNLTDSATLVLKGTTYTVGTVDVSLDTKYRAIDISTNTLDALNKLAEYWDCTWQADNNKINFIDYKNNFKFNGLYITNRDYLKNMSLQLREDSIITRLQIRGVNDISVNMVNNGNSYIDDFSFYMNTHYMPQNMIDALNSYQTAITNSSATYTTYLNELNSLQSTLLTKEDELVLLQSSLNNKQIEIDTASADGQDTSTLRAEYNSINNSVNTKQAEINSINNQISAKNKQINTLNSSLSISHYLTDEQLSLLNEFVKEEEFVDNTITAKGIDIDTLRELLSAAREYLSLNNQPRFDAEVDIVSLNQIINDNEMKQDYNKLITGSLVKINVKELGVNIDARIIEIEESFDDYSLIIKIRNQKDIQDPSYRLEDLLGKANNANNLISINIDKWSQGEIANSFITQNIANGINTLNTEIRNSTNTYHFDERGGVFVDKDNPNYATVISGKGILLSTDGGVTSSICMGKGQIYGEKIGSKIITANTGLFNRMETYDTNNKLVCEIGNYTALDGSTQRGIGINGGSLLIKGNAPALNFGNNVKIDSTNGINVTRSDNKVQTTMNSTNGFKIVSGSGNGTFPTNIVVIDTNGKAIFSGEIIAKDFKDLNGNSFLSADKTKIEGSVIKADTLYVNSANITGWIVADELRGRVANLSESVNVGTVSSSTQQKTINFVNNGSDQVTLGYNGSSFYINSGYNPTSIWSAGLDLSSSTNMSLSADKITIYGDVEFSYGRDVIIKSNLQFTPFCSVFGLTTSTDGEHNHGIPHGTRLLTEDGGTVVWVQSGSHSHDVTT